MKNFYEATVTRPKLFLDLNLTLKPIGIDIPCKVLINKETVCDEIVSDIKTISTQVSLLDPIDISIQIERQHPQAIQVVLVIDDYEIIPKYQHHANPPVDYIDTNDEWTLTIPNFYQWYHIITGQGWIE